VNTLQRKQLERLDNLISRFNELNERKLDIDLKWPSIVVNCREAHQVLKTIIDAYIIQCEYLKKGISSGSLFGAPFTLARRIDILYCEFETLNKKYVEIFHYLSRKFSSYTSFSMISFKHFLPKWD
jgi:hypothetical protein